MVFDQISNLGGNVTPAAFYDVFGTWELIAIPIVAVFAALLPARWAARTNVMEVPRRMSQ